MTADAGAPRGKLWAVQFTHGGIPEDPELYEREDVATRRFAELAVLNGIDFDPEEHSTGFIGNDDDEVRMWEVAVAIAAPIATHYGGESMTEDELLAVGMILGWFRAWAQVEKEKALAEDPGTHPREGGPA